MRTSTPASGGADGADARFGGRVDADHRAGLGETVSLEDRETGGVEEAVDLARERRAAGDEEPDAAADPRGQAREDEGARDGVAHRQAAVVASRPARRSSTHCVADGAGPEKDPARERAAVHRLVDARRRRPFRTPGAQRARTSGGLRRSSSTSVSIDSDVRDRRTGREHQVVIRHAAEDVRQRQETQRHVLVDRGAGRRPRPSTLE